MTASLVLDSHPVAADLEVGQWSCVFAPFVLVAYVAVPECWFL